MCLGNSIHIKYFVCLNKASVMYDLSVQLSLISYNTKCENHEHIKTVRIHPNTVKCSSISIS